MAQHCFLGRCWKSLTDTIVAATLCEKSHLSPKTSVAETFFAMVSKIAVGFIFIAIKIGGFLCFFRGWRNTLMPLVVFISEINTY